MLTQNYSNPTQLHQQPSQKSKSQCILNLKYKITQLSIQNQLPKPLEQFRKCGYISGDSPVLVIDETIRKCDESICDNPQLTLSTTEILQKYLQQTTNQILMKPRFEWKVLSYGKEGHFVEHIDRQMKKPGLTHIGSQILFPPNQLCRYEGGALDIKVGNQRILVRPTDNLWTHVILPLGIVHLVHPVTSGRRISYVRSIYIEESKDAEVRAYIAPKVVVNGREVQND